MKREKTDLYRLKRIIEIGGQLLETVERRGITSADINDDYEVQWLITTPLYNIGEQTNCLSVSLTTAYKDVPWAQIAGLRHRLVHNYEGTNWSMIAEVVLEELRPFVAQVQSIVEATTDEPLDNSDEEVDSES